MMVVLFLFVLYLPAVAILAGALVVPTRWLLVTLLAGAIVAAALPGDVFVESLYVGGVVCILCARFAIRSLRAGLDLRRALSRYLLVSTLAFPVSLLPWFVAPTIAARFGYDLFFGEGGMIFVFVPWVVFGIYAGVFVALLLFVRVPNRNLATLDGRSSRRGD
jgi:hypothetical protein